MAQEDYIAISGGFDPVHAGHVRMMFDAAAFGKLIVILNSDAWLMRKKGYVFMPWQERREVLTHYRFVHGIVEAMDEDDTVCESLKNLKHTITYFGKGGDRSANNTPELDLCERLEIPVLFGLGGSKVQSSSNLVRNVQKG